LFHLDGRPLGQQASLTRLRRKAGTTTGALQPADFSIPGEIRLQPVVQVERPNGSVLAILLTPLCDPLAAVGIFMVGSLILGWKRITDAHARSAGAPTR
jgi:hypothetical protein